MTDSLRRQDSATEVEIGKFLDREFYPTHVSKLVRYNDMEAQMSGIDVKFDYGNLSNMLVDEKVAARYVNKDIPTFAFEVNFLLHSKQIVDGWLFNKDKATQYYLLGWIWATKDKGFSADEITKMDILILRRQSIIDMLSRNGLTQADALSISQEIRNSRVPGVSHRSPRAPYYFYFSTQLAEEPINIIIKKSALINLAAGRHIITNK